MVSLITRSSAWCSLTWIRSHLLKVGSRPQFVLLWIYDALKCQKPADYLYTDFQHMGHFRKQHQSQQHTVRYINYVLLYMSLRGNKRNFGTLHSWCAAIMWQILQLGIVRIRLCVCDVDLLCDDSQSVFWCLMSWEHQATFPIIPRMSRLTNHSHLCLGMAVSTTVSVLVSHSWAFVVAVVCCGLGSLIVCQFFLSYPQFIFMVLVLFVLYIINDLHL